MKRPYLAQTKTSAVPISSQILGPRCVQFGPQLLERDDVLSDLGKTAQQLPVCHVQLDQLRCKLTITSGTERRRGWLRSGQVNDEDVTM